MSGIIDELLQRNETASVMTEDQLLRNAFDKVAVDGTGAQGSMQHDAVVSAINGALMGVMPRRSRILTITTTTPTLMIRGQTDKTIILFDIFCSLSAASNITFIAEDLSTILFPTFRAINAGQGFCFNSVHGFPILRSKSFFIKSSAAITLEAAASFIIV